MLMADPDKELQALEKLWQLLILFDAQARARMIGYLLDRHNAEIHKEKIEVK